MTNREEAKQWAEKYDSALTAKDKRFNKAVLVVDEEGTVLMFQNAFAVMREVGSNLEYSTYIYVFTEHHGFHVYSSEDVNVIQYSGREGIEIV